MNNQTRKANLAVQVARRMEVLTAWLTDGVPADAVLPSSLTKARLWDDASLGIEPIGSPSSFSTTHPDYGSTIKGIQARLASLHEEVNKRTKPKRQPLGRLMDRETIKHLEASRVIAGDQLLAVRAELNSVKRDFLIAEGRERGLERRCKELEDEVRRLRSAAGVTGGNLTIVNFKEARIDDNRAMD